MSLELILFLVALLAVVWRCLSGFKMGATVELRYAIVFLFALLVAMRYWYQISSTVSEYVSVDPQYLAAGVCIALFLAGAALAALIVDLKGQIYLSVRSNPLDTTLGVLAGLVSGGAIACSILMAASVALPGKVENFATKNYPLPVHEYPTALFRVIEQNVAHIAKEANAHTPLPTIKSATEAGQPRTLSWE